MENMVYRLPDSAIYGSPVYIHSHAYKFYNQLSLQSARQTEAMQQLHNIQNGVVKILIDNINTLIKAQQVYESKGFNIDLINLNASFKELVQIKAESLMKNTISHQVAKYRRKVEEKLLSLIEKWLDGNLEDISDEIVRIIQDFIGEEIYNNKYVDKINGEATGTKELKKYLKTIKTWMIKQNKGPEYIAKRITAKFINHVTLERLGLLSELDKMASLQRRDDIIRRVHYMAKYFLEDDVVWTTENITAKVNGLLEFATNNLGDANIYAKGMPSTVGNLIGNLFELEIIKYFYENKNIVLNGLINKNGVEIRVPDIVPQKIQDYITTDVDLGIILKELPRYSLGISAKTSHKGMRFKSSFKAFDEELSEETVNLLFYIFINYYALQNYEANGRSMTVNFLGDNLIESLMQALFIVENVGKLLGSVFIKKDISNSEDESLQSIMIDKTSQRISLPILLEFPNKVVYTSELLEKVFNEFNKQAQGAFNKQFEKYISKEQLIKNWEMKQMTINDEDNKVDKEHGMLYIELSDATAPWMIDTVDLSKANWFKFAANYNKDWLTK